MHTKGTFLRFGHPLASMKLFALAGAVCSLVFARTVLAIPGSSPTLALTISVDQPVVTAPFPVRIRLRLHNSGERTVWLYRHVRDPLDLARLGGEADERPTPRTSGGSTLVVELSPVAAPVPGTTPPAAGSGRTLASVGLPHPKLFPLAPGGDYQETAMVALTPAEEVAGGKRAPEWGEYRLSARYGAHFSNAAEIERDLGLTVWEGEVVSNTVSIQVAPPPPTARGSVAGVLMRPDGALLNGMLVSLTDRGGHLVEQTTSDNAGAFAFSQLPLDFYWVTARREGSSADTATFQHVELGQAAPNQNMKLVALASDVYESKQLLHKPVLVRVRRRDGSPAGGVSLKIVWSSGTVIENIKAETSEDGVVVLELVPGPSYVTLEAHGCRKEDTRIDVAEGGGIDDAALTLDCARR